jgi:hypothetical protein
MDNNSTSMLPTHTQKASPGNNPNLSQQGSSRATTSGSRRKSNNTPSNTPVYVFIGVKCGDEHKIAEINVHEFGDDQFFEELRAEYYKLKGRLRHYFSIWRFKHCDFVKVNTTLLLVTQHT